MNFYLLLGVMGLRGLGEGGVRCRGVKIHISSLESEHKMRGDSIST